MNYYVYILKSLNNNRYYIGQTKDLEKRIRIHNSLKARWTKRYQPWELVHSEIYLTRSEAIKREMFLKNIGGVGKKLIKIINGEI
jgi:putative endonuclease